MHTAFWRLFLSVLTVIAAPLLAACYGTTQLRRAFWGRLSPATQAPSTMTMVPSCRS